MEGRWRASAIQPRGDLNSPHPGGGGGSLSSSFHCGVGAGSTGLDYARPGLWRGLPKSRASALLPRQKLNQHSAPRVIDLGHLRHKEKSVCEALLSGVSLSLQNYYLRTENIRGPASPFIRPSHHDPTLVPHERHAPRPPVRASHQAQARVRGPIQGGARRHLARGGQADSGVQHPRLLVFSLSFPVPLSVPVTYARVPKTNAGASPKQTASPTMPPPAFSLPTSSTSGPTTTPTWP